MNEIKVKTHGAVTEEKILLVLLPFWDPQIPPLGIACLKSYLQLFGYQVKAVDANLEVLFREFHDSYFSVMQEAIPANKIGNLFNIGNQVFRNHLMAHLNYTDQNRYLSLVKNIVWQTFYTDIDNNRVARLNRIINDFFTALETYFNTLLDQEQPTVLGLSVYGDTFPASLAAFKWAKQKNASIKTIIGGGIFADQLAPGSPNLEYFIEKTKEYIDAIIIGEGEELMVRFLKGELEPTQRVYGLLDVQGKYVDMSGMDIPDFSDFDLNPYPFLAHFGARSCPYQCHFCSETINWGKYRRKDVTQSVAEFIRLYKRHGMQLFLLTDSTLNPIVTPLANEFIKSGVAIYWDGFLRADKHVCNIDNTILWRQGGFYRAKLGLESGSQRVLDLMNKEITIEQSRQALAALAFAGIKTTTFWLFGFPGETEADFLQTLAFLTENKDTIYEADCNAFNYFLTGQANSEEWLKNNKGVLLYPEIENEVLISPTWVLDGEPSREEAYNRVNRFIDHCKKLGIPNPYSLKDVCRADERWQKIHKNAVPAVVDFKNKDIYIDECRRIKKITLARNILPDNEDWL